MLWLTRVTGEGLFMKIVNLIAAAIVGAFIVGVSVSVAQELPASVTDAYMAYTEAVEANDLEAARRAAREAWQAGEAAEIDAFTLAILADNYAQLSGVFEEYRNAANAYARAGELLDEIEEDMLLRAQTWRLAAESALAAERRREYRSYLQNARQRIESADAANAHVANEAANIVLLETSQLWGAGSHLRAGRLAVAAFESGLLEGAPPSQALGMLAFYSGASAFVRAYHGAVNTISYSSSAGSRIRVNTASNAEAAFWLSAAYYFMEEAGVEGRVKNGVRIWSEHIRSEMTPGNREELLRRLSEADYLVIPVEDVPGESDMEGEASGSTSVIVRAVRIHGPAPRYPLNALEAGVEGFAVVSFDVSPEGETDNIHVLYSIPYSDFGAASMRVVENWRYSPKTVDGDPVWSRELVTQFNFSVEG